MTDETQSLILPAGERAETATGNTRGAARPMPSQMLDLFVHIHKDDQQQVRLDAAIALVRSLGAHLACVQVSPYIGEIAVDPFGGAYYVPEASEARAEIDAAERTRVEALLSTQLLDGHSWVHVTGDPVPSLVQAASLADLLVVSSARPLAASSRPRPLAGRLAIATRAPILVLPDNAVLDLTRPAMIAWNGSFEAAQALRFAVPLLALVPQVEIAVVGDESNAPSAIDAQAYLSRRGIESSIVRLHASIATPTSSVLIKRVATTKPAFIVMGAYGHTRALELVFGGVTQAMLEQMPAPLVLAH